MRNDDLRVDGYVNWQLGDESGHRWIKTQTSKAKGARILLCVHAKIGQLFGCEVIMMPKPKSSIPAFGQVIEVARGRLVFMRRLWGFANDKRSVPDPSTEQNTYDSGV